LVEVFRRFLAGFRVFVGFFGHFLVWLFVGFFGHFLVWLFTVTREQCGLFGLFFFAGIGYLASSTMAIVPAIIAVRAVVILRSWSPPQSPAWPGVRFDLVSIAQIAVPRSEAPRSIQ